MDIHRLKSSLSTIKTWTNFYQRQRQQPNLPFSRFFWVFYSMPYLSDSLVEELETKLENCFWPLVTTEWFLSASPPDFDQVVLLRVRPNQLTNASKKDTSYGFSIFVVSASMSTGFWPREKESQLLDGEQRNRRTNEKRSWIIQSEEQKCHLN